MDICCALPVWVSGPSVPSKTTVNATASDAVICNEYTVIWFQTVCDWDNSLVHEPRLVCAELLTSNPSDTLNRMNSKGWLRARCSHRHRWLNSLMRLSLNGSKSLQPGYNILWKAFPDISSHVLATKKKKKNRQVRASPGFLTTKNSCFKWDLKTSLASFAANKMVVLSHNMIFL